MLTRGIPYRARNDEEVCYPDEGIPDQARNDGNDGNDGNDEETVILNLIRDPFVLTSDAWPSGGFRIESGMTGDVYPLFITVGSDLWRYSGDTVNFFE